MIRRKGVYVMLTTNLTNTLAAGKDDSCHVRIWSGECEHTTFETIGDKYLCDVCETVKTLNHGVKPAAMPYVSGDYDNLS